MKKIILFFVFIALSFYGLADNPNDPPSKSGDNVVTIKPTSPVTTDECSDLCTSVSVDVVVTITDCPYAYDCAMPNEGCNIRICIYQGIDCSGPSLGCVSFDTETCVYRINVSAEEFYYLSAKLVYTGCTNNYGNGCQMSSGQVPSGGGTVYIDDLTLCSY